MSEDNSNTNGLGTDPMQRLASFKPPRDLSLGGVKPSKKVFTPNLSVTRNKNKGAALVNNRNQKKDDKNRKDRKNDKNRNFKNGPNVIKSSGVFSEGLGSAERHYSRSSYGRDGGDSAPTLQKPTIRVKDFIKIDKELEEQKIKSVFGEMGNIDDDSNEDFKQSSQTLECDAPIKLPMDNRMTEPALRPLADIKTEVFENTDVVNLLRSNEPTLILLQLPDSLPGRGGSVDDDAPRRNNSANNPSTSSGDDKEDKPVDNRCRLKDLEEGRIGKLLVHRSGRVSLALGDTIFEVSMGTKAAFHQEVVSVASDDGSRSANLISLGALNHKLNLLPDWEDMFKNITV